MTPSKWLVLLVLLPLGFLVLRLSALESKVEWLTQAVARLESREPIVAAAPPVVGRGSGVIVIAPDGGISGDSFAALSGAQSPERGPGLAAVRQARRREDKHILQVMERERDRIADRHLAFHQERWMESRETGLAEFAEAVRLSPVQSSRLNDLARGEVEHMVDMLRQPRFRDDPQAFIDEWDGTLSATDRAVRSVLSAVQLEAWEEGRAFERAVFFPWLPQ